MKLKPGDWIAMAGPFDARYHGQTFSVTQSPYVFNRWIGIAPDGWKAYFNDDGTNANGVEVHLVRRKDGGDGEGGDAAVASRNPDG